MNNRLVWIALSLIATVFFGVYAVNSVSDKQELSIDEEVKSVSNEKELSINEEVKSVSNEEELSIDEEVKSVSNEEELAFDETDMSKVEILTDENGYEYYLTPEDDWFAAGDRVYINEDAMPDLRDPEEIARDLFLEGKRVEYERRLDRPISDAEFQVLYEQDYKQEQQAQQRKRNAEYAYRQANPTGIELASRRSFCGDDAICMRTGIK